jgi:peptidoglycan/LPS O-acetylase OafA/YrhL
MNRATLNVGSESNGAHLDELVAATPSSRDRYVDFLRAASIGVVVLGHWLSALIAWKDGELNAHNAVGIGPWLCYTTWILQVMPVFFFVGGFSNFKSLDRTFHRGESALQFLRARLVRLLTPAGVFIWVWLMILLGLRLAGALTPGLVKSLLLVVGILWFLLVYLFITLLAPVTYRLHRRFGAAAILVIGSLAIVVDVLRFVFGMEAAGWANMVFVWVFVHQLGFFYADGTLTRARRRTHLAMALGGLAALLVLTTLGAYPKSMVSTGFERASNMSPPTVCILALTLWLAGAAMYLRGWANRWLARPGPWKVVVAANSVIMTVFLWHLSAYAAVFGVLSLLGFSGSAPLTANWWLERSIWVGGAALVLIPLVLLFGRFERPTLRPRVGPLTTAEP